MSFSVSFATRWADFDPNNHMRHSSYNDYAAESRVRLFDKFGLSLTEFRKHNVGPVLFREETNFFREIGLGENIRVEVLLKGASENFERFRFLHRIYRGDGKLAAEIEVLGAWLDLALRKITDPPQMVTKAFSNFTKTEEFENISLSRKKA